MQKVAQKLPNTIGTCPVGTKGSVNKKITFDDGFPNSGAPRAGSGRSGAQCVRKFGNLPCREVLVIT